MPVYLCKPGWNSQDPWRHGVQVYAYPFPIEDGRESGGSHQSATSEAHNEVSSDGDWFVDGGNVVDGGGEYLVGDESGGVDLRPPNGAENLAEEMQRLVEHTDEGFGDLREGDDEIDGGIIAISGGDEAGGGRSLLGGGAEGREEDYHEEQRLAGMEDARSTDTPAPRTTAFPSDAAVPRSSSSSPSGAPSGNRSNSEQSHAPPVIAGPVGVAVRRVRHAEVVLVDEVRAVYDRYWLRLRWPGPRGGVAGYIALGRVEKLRPLLPLPAPARLTTDDSHVSLGDVANLPHSRALSDGDASLQSGTTIPAQSGLNQQDDQLLDSKIGANVEENEGESGGSPGLVAARSSDGIFDGQDQPLHRQPLCESTGLYFPSSATMELLAMYDDGISSSSSLHNPTAEDHQQEHLATNTSDDHVSSLGRMSLAKQKPINTVPTNLEPVFCRICREGLHDVNYDRDETAPGPSRALEPTLLMQGGDAVVSLPNTQNARTMDTEEGDADGDPDRSGGVRENGRLRGVATHQLHASAIEQNDDGAQHETEAAAAAKAAASAIQLHHPSVENPLLAPCECSGSMRFVHYLCVEQWRCRSRHPDARQGLHCETCGAAYTLPPPPSRPVAPDGHDPAAGGPGNPGDEEWLEQMPPHVIAALRQPHLWWQIGAEILRRRWLRPVAPVIMSPIVALYCRARRMLKKRGVSRRRWACSLCRRRARWKCVRCLRSYYCSRQCQNVSWHIVHKHVCYKPSRFWWSVVVYGVGLLVACPGILKDPAVYDLGVGCLRCSFFVMGVIGGGIATVMKRGFGVDVRGRCLEIAVVLMTLWMTLVSWGLVWAFFDDPQQCWGTFSMWNVAWKESVVGEVANRSQSPVVAITTKFLLRPSKWVLDSVDAAAWKTGPQITKWICSSDALDEEATADDTGNGNVTSTCFRMVRNANPEFFYDEVSGPKCVSDMNTILAIWIFAGLVLLASSCLQRRERDRRAARGGGRGVAREERNAEFLRPHQD